MQQHDSDADSDWDVADDELGDPQDVTYDDDLGQFSAADEAAFNAFMAPGGDGVPGEAPTQGGSLLSDMILAKLEAAGRRQGGADAVRAASGSAASPSAQTDAAMDETMEQIYTDVGKLLQRCATQFRRNFF